MAPLSRCSLLRIVHHLSLFRALLLGVAVTVLLNEYLVYWVQSWRWPKLPIESRDPHQDLVILLVADPQIQGYRDEPMFPMGPITRWDADRYLRWTFSLAYSHVLPDVVIVLGDIMDEGSKAFDYEYKDYLERVHNIFYPAKSAKMIYIPGDNDIGGEGGDFRTSHKIARFEKHFENLTGIVTHQFVDFIKLDLQLHKFQSPYGNEAIKKMTSEFKAPMHVILNHETVMPKMKRLIHPILMQLQPQLIITAHWHVSRHFVCDDCLSQNEDDSHWPVHQEDMGELNQFVEISLENPLGLHEVMVPTCSYRMGVKDMGYGVAVVTNRGRSLKYTVLWLPSRYLQLYAYLIVLIFLLAAIVAVQLCCRPRQLTFTSRK